MRRIAHYGQIISCYPQRIDMTESLQADVLVIGGGAAGLTLTLQLAESYRVTLVAKSSLTEGSSLYAQGGIASVSNNDNDT